MLIDKNSDGEAYVVKHTMVHKEYKHGDHNYPNHNDIGKNEQDRYKNTETPFKRSSHNLYLETYLAVNNI